MKDIICIFIVLTLFFSSIAFKDFKRSERRKEDKDVILTPDMWPGPKEEEDE